MIWLAVIAVLLAIPFTLMQVTDQVSWDLLDFAVAGGALLAIGLTYELIARKSEKAAYRGAFAIGLLGVLLLFWVNGAVGIIGNEGQPANLLYGGVIGIALVGAILARFKAGGMARALLIAAIAQMLVPVVALFIWPPATTSWSPGVPGVFLMTAFFTFLFVVSSMLFRKASLQ